MSCKMENLVRKKVQVLRTQPKPIKQRIITWKRKCTTSLSSYLLLLLPYFSCLGSILKRIMGEVNNTIRRFVSNKILRKRRQAYHGWRAVMQFLNDPLIILTGLVVLLCGFYLFQVLLSKCWDCGMIWKVLSNKIEKEELERGDHIYTWRRAYSYAHHGIYAGNGMVIHYTRRGSLLRSSPSHHSNSTHPSSSDQSRLDRVIHSPIKEFLSGGELYRFEYGVNLALFIAKTRGGTCTLACSDPPDLVLDRASSLVNNGFGMYHLFRNNCEDFASYCKTGLHLVDNGFGIGRSGQAASFLLVIFALISFPTALLRDKIFNNGMSRKEASFLVAIRALLSSRIPIVRITSHFIGRRGQLFILRYIIYSAFRWASDIGIRRNVSRAANSRLAEEESSGYGVSIKVNSAFLKGLAWNLLVFTAWFICFYVLELTTDITSFNWDGSF